MAFGLRVALALLCLQLLCLLASVVHAAPVYPPPSKQAQEPTAGKEHPLGELYWPLYLGADFNELPGKVTDNHAAAPKSDPPQEVFNLSAPKGTSFLKNMNDVKNDHPLYTTKFRR
ncbi:hypothetical protein SYNPS1DRAFT_28346 [Syncephalis pseudoplumigaleata]|uniref:Uncharacterized protein n=1 Tax=Syncephalis pseudoplumigaleata TaxID=1712513 RepID=A0A4P9Z366_9FUNG|nr:hypothetical protein SYNPS1DRAFT_28346 [Syncephalis pseudoplumigaleata]|eukprot:RKP25940.1 hypothetical protein SYNPS1DRAFT_28346 [Syncephalis pseudoplumigaleata]